MGSAGVLYTGIPVELNIENNNKMNNCEGSYDNIQG